MRTTGIALCALTALALPVVPVNAPRDGCPPPYEALTEAEQHALARQDDTTVADVEASMLELDRNRDGTLCFMRVVPGFPVIDNRSGR